MKLEKILNLLNSLEKNSFLKIIDSIISDSPKHSKEIDIILEEGSKELKSVDSMNIARIFNLVKSEYTEYLNDELTRSESQLDILIDILTRDGRCILKQDWFSRLYEKEVASFEKSLKFFNKLINNPNPDVDSSRFRDYNIFRACITTAYCNDEVNNQEKKITSDEQSILLTLSNCLELSQEEIKLIKYSVLPIIKKDIDSLINELKNFGVLFYSRKNQTAYIPQEIVGLLRDLRGKEIADKYFRRVLRQIREPQINFVCRKHNIDWKLPINDKIEKIIAGGITLSSLITNDIFKENTNLTEKKKYFNDLCEKSLKISPPIKGTLLEEKVSNLIDHYNNLELDERVSISVDGYEKLLNDLQLHITGLNNQVKSLFALQDENVLKSSFLLDFNLKPQDILDIIEINDLKEFISKMNIKSRGDLINNVLDHYKDSENIYLENFENIAYRNHNLLKENGISLPDSELGVKFEDLTKTIFSKLGFNVDEELRKKLNTKKDKIDIVLKLDNNNLIVIECKSVKESGYNKFSSVYRQLKAYRDLASKNDLNVVKSLLIAPEFTDDFINECELEYELNLSLITAESLINIYQGFKSSKLKQLPYKLLMRDVVIQSERILKAIH